MGLAIGNEYNHLNYSNSITKNNSVAPQEKFPGISINKKSGHALNTGEFKFVMENGMAEGAYVDGIKMDLADIFLTNSRQLKERINEKYNKTDAERLEEIFGL